MIEAGIARFVQYAGAAVLFGAPLFYLTALPKSGLAAASELRWSRPFIVASAAMVVLGAAFSLVFQSATMNGIPLSQLDWPSIELVLTATQWGLAIAIRIALAALALGLALGMRPSRRLWAGAAALGLLTLAGFPWTGHGAASEGPWAWVHLVSDVIHSVAAGVWIGSLACFLMLVLKPAGTNEEGLAIHSALHGFAGTGSLVVSTLVVTGIVNTIFIVGADQVPALLSSSYGWVLGVKLLAFAGMVGLAAVNRFRLTPALKLSLDLGQTTHALPSLRRSLLIETALGFSVLFLVGVLGLMEPPTASN